MRHRSYKLADRADELSMGVRFLRPAAAAVMLSTLVLFWTFIFFIRGQSAALFVLCGVTNCLALYVAFYISWASVRSGWLTTWSGPLLFGRQSTDSLEIEEILCTVVRGFTGRSMSERYALMANARYGTVKPRMILYGFVEKDDAMEAGQLLAARLNAHRPAGLRPVSFRLWNT